MVEEQISGWNFGWYAPLDGDGKHVGTYAPEIAPSVQHMVKVALAAEEAGFQYILVPTSLLNSAYAETGPRGDPITTATAILMATKRLRVLLAFKIGEIHLPYLAKLATSLDIMSGGRLALNITSGGGSSEPRFGERLDHDERLARTTEAVTLLKNFWTKDRFSFEGKYYHMSDVFSEPKPIQNPHPPLFGVGQSEMAKDLSAAEMAVHLMQCNTPEIIKDQVKDIRTRARARGRNLRFGLRAQVMVRDTEREAWDAMRAVMSKVDSRVVATRRDLRIDTDATEVAKLIDDALSANLIAPNVWNGMHAVKAGAGTVLIGSPQQLADRCLEFARAGIESFIFSGYPHDAEATQVGTKLLPVIQERMRAEPSLQERALESAT